MNPFKIHPDRSISAGLLLLSLLSTMPFSGCTTSTHHTANQSANSQAASLTQLRDDLRATQQALDRTTQALNRIPTSANVLNAYQGYTKELTEFETLSAKSRLRSPNVHETGSPFFTQWEQSTQAIQEPSIREIAEQRRTDVLNSYNALRTPLVNAGTDLIDVTAVLTDLRKALAMDLTASGINALQKPLEKASRRSAEFSKSLDSLASQLDTIANSIPAPPASPAK
jgi:Protein of unknown function (DUF2959)